MNLVQRVIWSIFSPPCADRFNCGALIKHGSFAIHPSFKRPREIKWEQGRHNWAQQNRRRRFSEALFGHAPSSRAPTRLGNLASWNTPPWRPGGDAAFFQAHSMLLRALTIHRQVCYDTPRFPAKQVLNTADLSRAAPWCRKPHCLQYRRKAEWGFA